MSAIPSDVRQLRDYGDSMADAVRDAGAQAAFSFDRDWSDAAVEALEELAADGREFTADDVRDRVGEPESPGALGAVFRGAAAAEQIKLVGYRRSRRLSRHAGVIGVWRGVIE